MSEEIKVAKAILGRRFLVSDTQLSTLFEYIKRNDIKRASILVKSIRGRQLVFESDDVVARDVKKVQNLASYIVIEEVE
jgi:hypothetical protein